MDESDCYLREIVRLQKWMADWIYDTHITSTQHVWRSKYLAGRVPSEAKKSLSVTFNVRESFLGR